MAEDPEGGGEKTEDASSRKLDKAREEGQVAKSTEVASVLVLIGGVLAIWASAMPMYDNLTGLFQHNWVFDKVPAFTSVDVVNIFIVHVEQWFWAVLPMFIGVYLLALAANVAQVGFKITWKAAEPKLSRLNPINGFKQKFSSRAAVEFVKLLIKVTVVFIVAYLEIASDMGQIMTLYDCTIRQILVYIAEISFWIFVKVCIIMLLVAILDYAYQKWKFLEDQKMTKKEVKDEMKQTEGDPMVKSRIRQLQQEAARKRMMADVPKADVVVTNPTRLAVAVKYDGLTMAAPMVLAKGAGPVAANIRRIARENDIPLVENKPLARNLYAEVDIGGEVPMEHYQAVAELLAYVYRLKGRGM